MLQIAEYIAESNPDRAESFTAEIVARVNKLAHQPLLYRSGRVPGTREMVGHPNYIVIYRIVGEVTAVLRILHAARSWP